MIFRLLAMLSILLAFGSCHTVDPELDPYIKEFKAEAKKHNVEIDDSRLNAHQTGFMFDAYAGYAAPNPFQPYIRVNAREWPDLDDTQRRILVFHEAGHMFLGRWLHNNYVVYEDWDTRHVFPLPKSIMYYSSITKWQFNAYKECYLYELFTKELSDAPECAIFKQQGEELKR